DDLQRRTVHCNLSTLLDLIAVIKPLAHLLANPDEHTDQTRARVVKADIADQEVPTRLSGGGDKPKCRGVDITGDEEVARLRHLVSENANAVIIFLRPNEEIIKD